MSIEHFKIIESIQELLKEPYLNDYYININIREINESKLLGSIDLSSYPGLLKIKSKCLNGTDTMHILSIAILGYSAYLLKKEISLDITNRLVVSEVQLSFKKPITTNNIDISINVVDYKSKNNKIYFQFSGNLNDSFYFRMSGYLIDEDIHYG